MIRVFVFVYGVAAYALFFGTFLYLVGFSGSVIVPKSIDSGSSESAMAAVLVDLGLLGLFAVQHSVMARPGFKRWWTRIVPAVLERSTFVLLSSLLLGLLFWQWRPIPMPVWHVTNGIAVAAIQSVFVLGWVVVLLGTFMTNHFDLFGLRQTWLYLRGREYTALGFTRRGLYRYLRHPLMVGFLLSFWATPRMSVGHLLFALVMTAYVLVAIRFEERDLVESLGDEYESYRAATPALLPRVRP